MGSGSLARDPEPTDTYSDGANSFQKERVGIIRALTCNRVRLASERAPSVDSRGAQGVTHPPSVHRRVNVVRDVANHDKLLVSQPVVDLLTSYHDWLIAPRPELWV